MKNNYCLICNSDKVQTIGKLGNFPPVNLLTENKNEDIKSLDLNLNFCQNCGHLQQEFLYDHKLLFSEYLYQSSTSNTLRSFFKTIANIILLSYKNPLKVLEIASNDGIFIENFINSHIHALGVEPAKNIADMAKKKGLNVINEFWPCNLNEKYNLIFAFNVIAHGPKPIDFFQSLLEVLDDDGVIIIQTSQIFMLENNEFDTIYHEHYSFFTLSSLKYLAELFNLQFSIFTVSVHGGSALTLFYRKKPKLLLKNISSSLGDNYFINEIKNIEKPKQLLVDNFQYSLIKFKENINKVINSYKKQGYKIVIVGAAAKTITVIFYSKIKFDMIVDEAHLKVDKYIPTTDIKILPFSILENYNNNCLFVIGAWNFYDELKKKITALREDIQVKDIFYTYFPSEKIE